ncbi:MAG: helix-turn-helix transcriptional regulator [Oscillospiraceae bacterium]|nr:helix-turn-helix transcriptional regulator [Oscillospiraceae bacterium]
MSLGNNLFQARKKRGLSQEEVAEKLGVSRQTISKWETDETLPDIQQSKQLALLYRLSLDELIDFDMDVAEVHQAIERTSTALEEKIDWTKAWGKKYPILLTYRQQVEVEGYAAGLEELLEKLKQEYGYSELDAFLILKDILAAVWKQRKQQGKR